MVGLGLFELKPALEFHRHEAEATPFTAEVQAIKSGVGICPRCSTTLWKRRRFGGVKIIHHVCPSCRVDRDFSSRCCQQQNQQQYAMYEQQLNQQQQQQQQLIEELQMLRDQYQNLSTEFEGSGQKIEMLKLEVEELEAALRNEEKPDYSMLKKLVEDAGKEIFRKIEEKDEKAIPPAVDEQLQQICSEMDKIHEQLQSAQSNKREMMQEVMASALADIVSQIHEGYTKEFNSAVASMMRELDENDQVATARALQVEEEVSNMRTELKHVERTLNNMREDLRQEIQQEIKETVDRFNEFAQDVHSAWSDLNDRVSKIERTQKQVIKQVKKNSQDIGSAKADILDISARLDDLEKKNSTLHDCIDALGNTGTGASRVSAVCGNLIEMMGKEGNMELKDVLVKEGSVGATVEAMERHRTNPTVQKTGCELLWLLIQDNPKGTEKLKECHDALYVMESAVRLLRRTYQCEPEDGVRLLDLLIVKEKKRSSSIKKGVALPLVIPKTFILPGDEQDLPSRTSTVTTNVDTGNSTNSWFSQRLSQ